MLNKPHPIHHEGSLGKFARTRLHIKLSYLKVHRFMRRHWYTRHLKAIIFSFISICFVLGGIGAIWVANLKIPDLSAFNTRVVSQSTKIYDRTGKILLYDIHDNVKRTVVPSASISPYLKNATVAIEDNRFYTNDGIEPLSIIRSIFADIFARGYSQGASTITQQVIKNSILTTDKTLSRKLKEWVLAIKLTHALSKDDILTTYLNETSYGGNIYGVEEASKAFFGKEASDLTLAQAAYIAALPQAPSYYSPYGSNTAALDTRAKLVLRQMLLYKLITQDQYNQAVAEKVVFLAKDTGNIRAPHFSLYVRNYLEQKYGEDMVLNGGLKVITTLDYTMQQKMESTVSSFGPNMEKNFNASNTAMVAIDPKTGDILALVGSRDYYDNSIDGNFNIAPAYRQPGSTFKPFVYATLCEKGYTPDTILWDAPIEFSLSCTVDGKPKDPTAATSTASACYSPGEYDNTFEGPMTIRYALPQSRNLPAVEALYLAGIPESIKTAQSMGITSLNNPSSYGLTLVLGGGEVSLLDMTSAYGVFANDGVRNPYRSVLEVDDSNGNVLEQAPATPSGAQQVIPVQVARQINDILSDTSARMPSIKQITDPMDRPIAVKTGTTNNYKDVWTMGYTPNLVVGAWAGKNDDTPMQDAISTLIITPEWGAFMTQALQGLDVENFKAPNPEPTDLKPVLRGIWKGGISYKVDTVSGKVATQYTPLVDQKEIVFNDVHSILQWVNKNDPQGPIPTDPTSDAQYPYWEYGVQTWLTGWLKTNPTFTQTTNPVIPTATDDVHIPANFPVISLTAPDPTIPLDPNQKVTITVTNSAKYPIQKSDLYINDHYILSNSTTPSVITFVPKDISGIQATNSVRIVVTDSVQDTGEASTTLLINQ